MEQVAQNDGKTPNLADFKNLTEHGPEKPQLPLMYMMHLFSLSES